MNKKKKLQIGVAAIDLRQESGWVDVTRGGFTEFFKDFFLCLRINKQSMNQNS
jgi:hypothetical protein